MRLPKIARWLHHLRIRLSTPVPRHPSMLSSSLPHPEMSVVYGAIAPENRYGVDQIPFNLMGSDNDQTYEETGSERVWIAQDKNGCSQHCFGTLQVWHMAVDGPEDLPRCGQPRIRVIFSGKGESLRLIPMVYVFLWCMYAYLLHDPFDTCYSPVILSCCNSKFCLIPNFLQVFASLRRSEIGITQMWLWTSIRRHGQLVSTACYGLRRSLQHTLE